MYTHTPYSGETHTRDKQTEAQMYTHGCKTLAYTYANTYIDTHMHSQGNTYVWGHTHTRTTQNLIVQVYRIGMSHNDTMEG